MSGKEKWKKTVRVSAVVLGTAFMAASVVAKIIKPESVYEDKPEEKNPVEGNKVRFVENEEEHVNADGVRGHLEVVDTSEHYPSVYEKYVKRGIDVLLSFSGLVVLSPLFATIALAVKIDDPGPVFFTQKRVGQNKQYFKLHKFRSMKMSTPHDKPTHMLENPDQYITNVGKFIRKHSFDELPQIWDIFIGNMSVIGPRPALWNQDLLTAERDKYGANDVKPGLTGLAQINGRDELEIPEKAKLDGEYCQKLGLKVDAEIFLKSLHVFREDDSIVEGGTGTIEHALNYTNGIYGEISGVPKKRKVMIIGKGSFIGESLANYLSQWPEIYEISVINSLGLEPTPDMFSGYDVVFDAAGIAHIKETSENRHLYYEVNRDLTVKIAESAKVAGVSQFIIMSSMSVYGIVTGHITKNTKPKPVNAYGDSKLQADIKLQKLENNIFKIAILRPPMVYGKGCKGNYQTLRKITLASPLFPNISNARSMVYIGNLCEFVKRVIDKEDSGIFFPQNKEYVQTSEMVRIIARQHNRKLVMPKLCRGVINLIPVNAVKKAFGSLTYDKVDLIEKYNFAESMELTEGYESEGAI